MASKKNNDEIEQLKRRVSGLENLLETLTNKVEILENGPSTKGLKAEVSSVLKVESDPRFYCRIQDLRQS